MLTWMFSHLLLLILTVLTNVPCFYNQHVSLRGPNVCESKNSGSSCCPGWNLVHGSCSGPKCNNCGRTGRCIKPNVCLCSSGRLSSKCEENSCDSPCLNGGTCNSRGVCDCQRGYSGVSCQDPICSSPCQNQGRCIGPNKCACSQQYTGPYCENEKRSGFCYRQTNNGSCSGVKTALVSTKILCCATIGKFWSSSCEPCKSQNCAKGYLKDSQTELCTDINECEVFQELCLRGSCINTRGSFYCSCPKGRVQNENLECIDEDECKRKDEDLCANGICINTDSGYICRCKPGFIPSQDQQSCLDGRQGYCYLRSDLRERCKDRHPFRMSRYDCCCGNRGKAWSYSDCISCPKKQSSEYTTLCSQINLQYSENSIDTCATQPNICGLVGRCSNTPSGYQCTCPSGFRLNHDKKSCLDIDECDEQRVCSGENALSCKNTIGSYECECYPGFIYHAEQRRCLELDECNASGRCRNGLCVSTYLKESQNSYTCECFEGYVRNNQRCIDIDECKENPKICLRGRCNNLPGKYECECDVGFKLSTDTTYCLDENECMGKEICSHGRCINSEGSYSCVCDPGFELNEKKSQCKDINECTAQPCGVIGTCVNTEGSFHCECPNGFSLSMNGRNCMDSMTGLCYTSYSPHNCLLPNFKPVTYSNCCCHSKKLTLGWGFPCKACPTPSSPEYTMLCRYGEGFTNEGNDINECIVNPNICGKNGVCQNIRGSYECLCNPGFKTHYKQCIDLNECELNVCKGGNCKNTLGSYICNCPSGTLFNSHLNICEDINECLNLLLCANGKCRNNFGSFDCDCPSGSVLDSKNQICVQNIRDSCWTSISENSCENNSDVLMLKSECCCSVIGKAWGSPCQKCTSRDCECTMGLVKYDGVTCSDINECVLKPNICQGGNCINTISGFKCQCSKGLTLDSSGTICIDQRLEPCYKNYHHGTCTKDLGSFGTRQQICCCSVGEAWGYDCSECPHPGSTAYRKLCSMTHGVVMESDVNECKIFPNLCKYGKCQNTIGSFICTCNTGYTLDEFGMTCVNINECKIMTQLCGNGTCMDTEGSFYCVCEPGFTIISPPIIQICVDIDECSRNQHVCQGGQCLNTPGSYICSCPHGHELSLDGTYCKDIDECSLTSGICSNGMCQNMMGAYKCICNQGYQPSSRGISCEDVNECAIFNGGCQDNCDNSPGSYSCSCQSGYELGRDKKTCQDIDECDFQEPCNGGKCRNTLGSFICICYHGFTKDSQGISCLDIDECQASSCKNGKCVNTLGSFECVCYDGYELQGYNQCEDVNECLLDLFHCHPRAHCNNTIGGYECSCPRGFTGDGFNCHDVNECLVSNGGCDSEARCVNTEGSFTCQCDKGYRNRIEGHYCEDIDECAENSTLCRNGNCINERGSFYCECHSGYTSISNTQKCVDINECDIYLNSVCLYGNCQNLEGHYRCICDSGFTLNSQEDNCIDINECFEPMSCQNGDCINREGSYECICPKDFTLLPSGNGCVDRRVGDCFVSSESQLDVCKYFLGRDVSRSTCCCSLGSAWNDCEPCPQVSSHEFNSICPGNIGFRPNNVSVILEDIDECLEFENICKNGRCINTFGSWICICQIGYQLNDLQIMCEDINECEINSDVCSHGKCVNTIGSYECVCQSGYVLSREAQKCIDNRKDVCYLSVFETQCSKPLSLSQTYFICCCSIGTAWGSQCNKCPFKNTLAHQNLCGRNYSGILIDPISGLPHEVDECSLIPGICKNGFCINTLEGFICECDMGFIYDESSFQCFDINECEKIDSPCRGNSYCVNTPGSFHCLCLDGYEMNERSLICRDINECSTHPCSNGQCQNVAGSYSCSCSKGFFLSENSCLDTNECLGNPDICGNGICQNTEGSYNCFCEPGFQLSSTLYCEDINECLVSSELCTHGRCLNNKGSYDCECSEGYVKTFFGCSDVNECELGICSHDCINTPGSFECICPLGYRLQGSICLDVNECEDSLGTLCKNGACINTKGSFDCNCPRGWILKQNQCIDVRMEFCYESRECSLPRSSLMTMETCCCSKGSSWGYTCIECPSIGSSEFKTLCPFGLGRGNHGEDLNECKINLNSCFGGDCINTDGSYRCQCSEGYVSNSYSNECVDENECLRDSQICGNGTCFNTIGGFTCDCNPGFTLSSSNQCSDVNECETKKPLCAFRCHNVPGSYRCVCPYGFTLAEDGRHCEDIDECSLSTHDCQYKCINIIGGYNCVCPDGFQKHFFSNDCVDINECETHPCGPGTISCINTQGGYRCICQRGYVLSPNGKRCNDGRKAPCFSKHSQCILSPSYSFSTTTTPTEAIMTKLDCCCTLGNAWSFSCELCPGRNTESFKQLCYSDVRINERHNDECQRLGLSACPNGQCINTHGSYTCICNSGYKSDGQSTHGNCIDVNECISYPHYCQHECRNTIGSYICSCQTGFELVFSSGKCDDVNECERNVCEFECLNTQGSYTCLCPPGFTYKDQRCVDINECLDFKDLCPFPGICINTKGSYYCKCPTGYHLDLNRRFCIDINECLDEEPRCSHRGNCINSLGSFTCECSENQSLCENDSNTCSKCDGRQDSLQCPYGYHSDLLNNICIQSCFKNCVKCPSSYLQIGKNCLQLNKYRTTIVNSNSCNPCSERDEKEKKFIGRRRRRTRDLYAKDPIELLLIYSLGSSMNTSSLYSISGKDKELFKWKLENHVWKLYPKYIHWSSPAYITLETKKKSLLHLKIYLN